MSYQLHDHAKCRKRTCPWHLRRPQSKLGIASSKRHPHKSARCERQAEKEKHLSVPIVQQVKLIGFAIRRPWRWVHRHGLTMTAASPPTPT